MRSMTSFLLLLSAPLLALSMTLCGGCTTSQTDAVQESASFRQNTDYVIGTGDLLTVFVWDNPELSIVNVPVRPDGKITTPLAEDVVASGKTAARLARDIEERLARFVRRPSVTVTVTEFVGQSSQQVKVVGDGVKPQSIPYRDQMTLLDVIISVTLNEYADTKRVMLVRSDKTGEQKTHRLRLDRLINKGDMTANIDVLPGDILIIPEASLF